MTRHRPAPGPLVYKEGVTISDAVQCCEDGRYGVDALVDSEGNTLWFCSEAGKDAAEAGSR